MKIITDASPLIGLARIERLDILYHLFDSVIVPEAVADECTEHSKKPGAVVINKAISLGGIDVYQESFHIVEALTKVLGKGETAAISLAYQLKMPLLIDDRRGRFFAKTYKIAIFGLGGLLLLAKEEGVIDAVNPVLKELHDSGYRLSDSLRNEIICLAGEGV